MEKAGIWPGILSPGKFRPDIVPGTKGTKPAWGPPTGEVAGDVAGGVGPPWVLPGVGEPPVGPLPPDVFALGLGLESGVELSVESSGVSGSGVAVGAGDLLGGGAMVLVVARLVWLTLAVPSVQLKVRVVCSAALPEPAVGLSKLT